MRVASLWSPQPASSPPAPFHMLPAPPNQPAQARDRLAPHPRSASRLDLRQVPTLPTYRVSAPPLNTRSRESPGARVGQQGSAFARRPPSPPLLSGTEIRDGPLAALPIHQP